MTSAADPSSPAPRPGALDRRDLLRKAAVGGAIVWTAPVLLSNTAASAGTCLPGTVLWSVSETDINNLDTTPFQVGLASGNTLDVTFDTTHMGSGTASASYATPAPLGAVGSSFIGLGMNAANAGDYVELTLLFSTSVQDLTFTILDIDRGTGLWQDEVTLTATGSLGAVTLGTGFTIVNPTNVGHTSTATTDTFTALVDAGGPGVPNTSNQGNVTVTYAQPVTQVVIRYAAGPGQPAPVQPQQIGITDLSFCLWP